MKSKITGVLILLCLSLGILIGFTDDFLKNNDLKKVNTDININSSQKEIIDIAKKSIMKSNNISSYCIRLSDISTTGDRTWRVYNKIKLSKRGPWNPTYGDYCTEVAQNMFTNKYSLFFDKIDGASYQYIKTYLFIVFIQVLFYKRKMNYPMRQQ